MKEPGTGHRNLLVSMLLRRAARGSFKYRKQNSTGNTGPSRKGGGKAMVDRTRNDESWPGLRCGIAVLHQSRVDGVSRVSADINKPKDNKSALGSLLRLHCQESGNMERGQTLEAGADLRISAEGNLGA